MPMKFTEHLVMAGFGYSYGLALGDLAGNPAIASIDLNPLIVVDGLAVAVDALVEVADDGVGA